MKKIILLPFVFLIASALFAIDLSLDMFKNCKIIFDEGVSYAQVTRIEQLDNRSNFVRENKMLGAYFTTQTIGLPIVDFELDIHAYYPFYYTFNGMKQKTHNIINYSFDGFLGAQKTFKQFKYVYINCAAGMHYMYQLTDEYHMHYLGLGGELGLEFPLLPRWTIVNRNFISYDNANLGTNKLIQKFDASYQYRFDLGVRYTRRVHNEYPYIKIWPKDKPKKVRKSKKKKAVVEGEVTPEESTETAETSEAAENASPAEPGNETVN